MKRRGFLRGALALSAGALGAACGQAGFASGGAERSPLGLSEAEWKDRLSSEAYRVLFENGTERTFSSALNAEKRAGTFVCAACQNPLFDAAMKYDSGTGWPSFWKSLEGGVETRRDLSYGMVRTEYHCAHCGGHQGHLFSDGPHPTGQRYCNNGVSLGFVPDGEPLPRRLERKEA